MEITNVDITRIDTKPEYNLGDFTWIGDKKYMYVKYNDGDGNVVGVAGYLAYFVGSATANRSQFEVTCDYNSATVVANILNPAGFLQAALTNGTYGWVQIAGPNNVAFLTDGNVVIGPAMAAGADGTVGVHDASKAIPVALAMEDDSGTALAAGKAMIILGGLV